MTALSPDNFWTAVNDGTARLSKTEDRRVWEMRGEGRSFRAIAEELIAERAARRVGQLRQMRLARAGLAKARALRWRDQYRKERGL